MTKKEQQTNLYKTWKQDQTPDNMSALLKSLDSTINSVAATHGATRDENLKWALRLHLAKDIKNRFDPNKASLQTFVYQSLQRTPRIKAQQRSVIHTPESSDADLRQLRRTRQELIDIHDREPSRAEIADRSGISIKRLEKLEKQFGKPSMNLSAFHTETGGMDPMAMGDTPATAQEQLYHQYAVDALDSTDRRIYDSLQHNAPSSKKEIAAVLGISAPAVSQRIEKINKALRFDG